MTKNRYTCLISCVLLIVAFYVGSSMPHVIQDLIHWIYRNASFLSGEAFTEFSNQRGIAAVVLIAVGLMGFVSGLLAYAQTRYTTPIRRWTIVAGSLFLLAYGMEWAAVASTTGEEFMYDLGPGGFAALMEQVHYAKDTYITITLACFLCIAFSNLRKKEADRPSSPMGAWLPAMGAKVVLAAMLVMGLMLTVFIPMQISGSTPADYLKNNDRIDMMVSMFKGFGVMLELSALLLIMTALMLPGMPKKKKEMEHADKSLTTDDQEAADSTEGETATNTKGV